MVKLIILLRTGVPATSQSDDYNSFLIALEKLPGLRRKSVSNVYGAASGHIPYSTIIEACFKDRHALEKALTSPEGVHAGNLLLRFAAQDAISLFASTLEEQWDPPEQDEEPE